MSKRERISSIGSLKINRISILNQLDSNFQLKKEYVNQKNLEKLKEFLFNHKNNEKLVDKYLTYIQSVNNNINYKENNNYKSNPLSKKSKIIREHNILKKIDFNTNSSKDNELTNNKITELNLFSNNSHNNNFTLYNKINFPNKKNDIVLNLPLLININKEKNSHSKIINNIHLYKNINKSSSFINNFEYFNISSPSVKIFNDIKNNKKNLFTNERIKNSYYKTPIIKVKNNYTDKEIQTNFDEIMDNNIGKKHLKKNNNNKILKEENDESSSNEFDNIKEIEKIISRSSLNIHNNNRINNNYKNYIKNNFNNNKNCTSLLNNSDNEIESKNEFILLKSLYKIKTDIKNNQYIEQSKTSRNIIFKTENNTNKKPNISSLNKNINTFNRNNAFRTNNKLNKKKKIKEFDNIFLYDNKNK